MSNDVSTELPVCAGEKQDRRFFARKAVLIFTKMLDGMEIPYEVEERNNGGVMEYHVLFFSPDS